ncbi:hypothetical protein ElyMa_001536800 [Elysia marginata]|uniref:Uncharacterized protein n=1 Tax=Elysia marginata TaxID=1093978 RepID=A0AAV4JBH6_9GAST|nr:hypothetical protein ElyMa_001536800 [Elysia marginata]
MAASAPKTAGLEMRSESTLLDPLLYNWMTREPPNLPVDLGTIEDEEVADCGYDLRQVISSLFLFKGEGSWQVDGGIVGEEVVQGGKRLEKGGVMIAGLPRAIDDENVAYCAIDSVKESWAVRLTLVVLATKR